MKILWLSHLIPYPPKGGVLQRSYNLVRELARYHQVDLCAFNQKKLIGPLFDSVAEGVEESQLNLGRICDRLQFHDISSDSTPWGPYALALKSLFHQPYNINWLKSSGFAQTMSDWLDQEDYDLVHFDTISLIPFFPLVPPAVTTVLDHHNIESHMLLRRSGNETNLLKRFYFWQEGVRLARYERLFCPRFSLNITCSDVDSDRLLELSPGSTVRTVPNGVDLDYFVPQGLPQESHRLIFVGTMNWYPNVEAVLFLANEIWPHLKKTYPDLECDIVGANPPGEIRALGDQLAGFNVHGFVDDVRPMIERASIYVCPIRDGGGTKLKILDAMAMGKAMVAHPVACEGIKVIPEENVLLADNPARFVEQIDNLLKSEKKRESLGANARKLMEESYGYYAIGQELSATLKRLVG